jgi:hypothetical protein
MRAIVKGVNEGRNGYGNIYVWASGDGGQDDDCMHNSFLILKKYLKSFIKNINLLYLFCIQKVIVTDMLLQCGPFRSILQSTMVKTLIMMKGIYY